MVKEFLSREGYTFETNNIEEDDAISLGMAVRECAVNAVVHGS